MKVTVVYARDGAQHVLAVDLPPGATVRQAIDASGLLALEPQLEPGSFSVGVWNRSAGLDDALADGDRIEVYRPLLLDPKEARRLRADARRRRQTKVRA